MRDFNGLDRAALDRYLTTDPSDKMVECATCKKRVHNWDTDTDGNCEDCNPIQEDVEDGR